MSLKSLLVLSVTSLSMAVLFSGCGMKSYGTNLSKELQNPNDVPGKIYYIEGKEAWRSPSAGYNAKTRNIHILQNAANLTLNEGYKYFSINRPIQISNFDGSLVNTAEDFIQKCTPPEGQIFDVGNGRCGFNGSTVTEGMMIVVFKEVPKTVLSYDAKNVVEYLKAKEMYREDGYEMDAEAFNRRLKYNKAFQ